MKNGKWVLTGVVCAIAVAGLAASYFLKGGRGSDSVSSRQSNIHGNNTASLVDQGRTKDWRGKDAIRVEAFAPGKQISDQDFQWALQKLDLSKAEKNSQIGIVTFTISSLEKAKLSPTQQKSLIAAALPLLSTDDPVYNEGDIESYACKVFIQYPDSKAVPRLHALLNSPHPWVRRNAARALAAAGENVAIPPRPTRW